MHMRFIWARSRSTGARRCVNPGNAATALPPPISPFPVLPLVFFLQLTLIVQNANLFAERLLQRLLRTKTRIDGVYFNPFRAKVSVKGLELSDNERKRLLSAPELTLSLNSWHNVDVLVPTVTLFSAIEGVNVSQNNWSRHIDYLRSQFPSSSPPAPTTSVPESDNTDVSDKGVWQANIRLLQTIVCITTGKSEKDLFPRIALPSICINSCHVSRASEVLEQVNDLIAQAIQRVGPRAFPRELRGSARRMVRGLTIAAAEKFLEQTNTRVKQIQERVEDVETYVKDLPEGEGVQRWLGLTNSFLKKLSSALDAKDKNESEGIADSKGEGKQREDVPIEGFRELDD